MILAASLERLVVVSDLHLGSPASVAWRHFPAFLDHVHELDADLCINGDGFDLLQSTFPALVAASLPTVRRLKQFIEAGRHVYYTVGNHDLAIEHLLLDLPMTVTPFLNVTSGTARIRVEHGHLHEPFYARHPQLYELGGRLASGVLVANADTYKLWAQLQAVVDRRRRGRPTTRYPHYEAASSLFERGFDAVVFGHTHHPERTVLPDGLFVNAGDWMTTGSYALIDGGDVGLHAWTR
ncbi:MAG: putative phosphatase protein [Acidimicrobiales bacterium]|jgi:UDP-2,3-diacylglucosamine pyrophosphatase LpxH|nr:putative phosphatase protein [Acidimicrobiales bacterium]